MLSEKSPLPDLPPPLPSDVQALLARASRAAVVDDTVKSNVWSAIEIKGGAAVTTAVLGKSAVMLSKPLLALLLTSAVIGGGVIGGAVVQAVREPKVVVQERVVEKIVERVVEKEIEKPVERIVQVPVPAASTPAKPANPAVPPADETAERLLIERARAALDRSDLPSVDKALREHTKQFPKGSLLEDREALRVLWLYQKGDAGADDARAAFAKRFPGSFYAGALDRAAKR